MTERIYRANGTGALGVLALIATFISLTAASAEATIINFDDLSNPSNVFVAVPNGYAGLNWTNFDVIDAQTYPNDPQNGYFADNISSPNVAYNVFAGGSAINAPGTGTFNLNSFYMTSAWYDGQTVLVLGFNALGAQIYSESLIPSATTATDYTLNYLGVNSVTFTASGGTTHAGYAGGGNFFAIDNVTVNNPVPEPASLLLLALGGAGLLTRRRARR